MKKKLLVGLATGILALCFCLCSGLVLAASFQNGSFEIGTSGDDIYELSNGSTQLTGWEVFLPGGNGTIEDVRTGYKEWISQDGHYSLDLNGVGSPGGIKQTFDTIINQNYIVTFYLSGNYYWGPDYELSVSADGVTQNYSSKASNPMIWELKTFNFT